MLINVYRQKLIYKKTFLGLTVLYSTIMASIKGLSTGLNLLLLLWGLLLFTFDYVKERKLSVKINKVLLLLFLMINLVTVALNTSKTSNLKILSLTVLQFFLLYSYDLSKDKIDMVKEMRAMSNSYIAVSFIFSFASFIMYVLKINFLYKDELYGMLHYGAFQGLYTGSNTTGLVALISIMLSFLASKLKDRGKYFYYFNIGIQLVILLVSKARSALLGLVLFGMIYIFVLIRSHRVKRVLILGAVGVIAALPYAADLLLSLNISLINKSGSLGFFSGRAIIWKYGIKVAEKFYAFGVGIVNVTDVVKKTAKVFLPGIDGGGMHNIYMEIAVANGVFALGLIVLFFIYTIFIMGKWLRRAHTNTLEKKIVGGLFALFITLYAVNFVEANIIYVANFLATVYWIFISYGIYFAKKEFEVSTDECS